MYCNNIMPELYLHSVSQNLADWEGILYHFNATIEDS